MYSALKIQLLGIFLSILSTQVGQAQIGSYEKARHEVDSLRALTEKEIPPQQMLHVYLELIGHYLDFSQLDSVQLYIDEGIRLNEVTGDSLKQFFLTAYQTEVFLYSTLYEQGIQTAMKGLQQAEQLKDPELLANQYNLLGLLYAEMMQHQQAIGFFELSLKYLPAKSHHYYGLTRRYHLLSNLAQCYAELKDIPTSIRYNRSSLQEAKRQKGFRGMAVAAWSLGNIFYEQGDYDQAQQNYQQSLNYAKVIQDIDMSILIYPKLFQLYQKQQKSAQAQDVLQQGLALAQQNTLRIKPNSLKHFYADVIDIYNQLSDYKQVVHYQEKLDNISQQIAQQEKQQRLAVLSAFYENEKRMTVLTLEKKEQENRLQQHKLVLRYAAVLGALIVTTLGAFYYAFRQKQRLKNWQLEQHIQLLEHGQEMAALRAMVDGEEQERVRIARELHDGLTGLLAAARHQVEATFRHLPDDELITIAPATQLLDKACTEVRRLSHNLMPYALQRHGLAMALEEYCLYVQQTGVLSIEYQQLGWDETRLSPSLELWIYRITQELVNNILKHAKATQALVQLSRFEDLIQITVEDNGRGFDKQKPGYQSGTGLQSIEARVKYLRGCFSVKSDNKGTSIHIELSLTHIPQEL